MKSHLIEEVEQYYQVISLIPFRRTEGVRFDLFPYELIPEVHSVDRVLHDNAAISPGSVGEVKRPWYMHAHQEDNLLVLQGERNIDIYKRGHDGIVNFLLTPERVYKNGKLLYDGPALVVWKIGVFHRITSGAEGSASINLATHKPYWNERTNFNIYDLDINTGVATLIRKGFEDQR